jgi:ParB family chromosome partitioning protein
MPCWGQSKKKSKLPPLPCKTIWLRVTMLCQPTKHAPAHPDRAKPSETLIAKPTAPDTSDTSHRKARLPRTTSKAAANKSRGIGSDTSVEDQISLVQIDVTRLQAGKYQPRRDMSETALAELASSIEQHGVMQPIACE